MKKIRLWKLGSIRDGIIPSKEGLEKLQAKITELVGEEEGVVNFVWSDDLTIEEHFGEQGLLKAGRIGYAVAGGLNINKTEDKKEEE